MAAVPRKSLANFQSTAAKKTKPKLTAVNQGVDCEKCHRLPNEIHCEHLWIVFWGKIGSYIFY